MWGKSWQRFSELRRRLPLWMQVSSGLLLTVLLIAGVHSIFLARTSMLHLRVQHSFRSGQITVFVDDDAVYRGKLSGAPRKKYAIFGETIQGSLTQQVPVTSGTHRVRVEITASDGTVRQDSTAQEFVDGGDRTLLVNARRGDLELSWLGGTAAEQNSIEAGGWLGRYGATLLMTLAGSIVSAITGFIIREIPGYLRSRQANQ